MALFLGPLSGFREAQVGRISANAELSVFLGGAERFYLVTVVVPLVSIPQIAASRKGFLHGQHGHVGLWRAVESG
jgi:hypothetical protein